MNSKLKQQFGATQKEQLRTIEIDPAKIKREISNRVTGIMIAIRKGEARFDEMPILEAIESTFDVDGYDAKIPAELRTQLHQLLIINAESQHQEKDPRFKELRPLLFRLSRVINQTSVHKDFLANKNNNPELPKEIPRLLRWIEAMDSSDGIPECNRDFIINGIYEISQIQSERGPRIQEARSLALRYCRKLLDNDSLFTSKTYQQVISIINVLIGYGLFTEEDYQVICEVFNKVGELISYPS